MHRLIYRSRAKRRLAWSELTHILEASTRHNEANGLTGVLLASSRHFMQVLEGDAAAVSETFLRIARDARHEDVRLVSFDVIDERLFGAWRMRGVGVFELDRAVTEQLVARYGEEDGDVRFPTSAWRALALIQDLQDLRDLPECSGEGPGLQRP